MFGDEFQDKPFEYYKMKVIKMNNYNSHYKRSISQLERDNNVDACPIPFKEASTYFPADIPTTYH